MGPCLANAATAAADAAYPSTDLFGHKQEIKVPDRGGGSTYLNLIFVHTQMEKCFWQKCNKGMMVHTTANNRTWDSRGQSDAEAAERKSGQGQKMNRYLSFLFLI